MRFIYNKPKQKNTPRNIKTKRRIARKQKIWYKYKYMEPATNLESRYTSHEKYIKLHKLNYIQSLYRIVERITDIWSRDRIF